MTMETKESAKVSDDELLTDIKTTELELSAYKMLCTGFDILQRLPENADDYSYYRKQVYYTNTHNRCAKFLYKLKALADERGLIYE